MNTEYIMGERPLQPISLPVQFCKKNTQENPTLHDRPRPKIQGPKP